ncbi:hypothetical protein [Saccharolobus shibatae]|uniref:Uncharacterized protein n=1 Tax=Saccharolobus shibatae TaxID=2286 RepID=A0A8F5GY23_9CREN|nr:hypothetical protein [Saccharolobus shibatae]QXJ33823.1 hypothetical protein J5U22_00368 [Saccharolobus shibatae]
MKGQASIVIGLILLILLLSIVIPLLIVTMTSPSYNIQGALSASQITQLRDQQMFDIEEGDPLITLELTPSGQLYLNFTFIHGFNPLQILGIYYFNSSSWVQAYPAGLSISSNDIVYLFTPQFYTGPIDILTSYGNQIILYPKMLGAEEYTNQYIVYLCTTNNNLMKGTLTINKGAEIEVLYQGQQQPQQETLSSTTTYQIYNGTEIFVPNATSLPPVIGPDQQVVLPNGTLVIIPTNSGTEAIKIIRGYSTIEIYCGVILQKIIHATGLPLSSFLTGYQSDNDNIGVLNATPSGGSNNPQLQSQTIIQWMISDSGINQPLTIEGLQNSPEANMVYLSPTAPLGGYAVWTGDAGIIVGNGISSRNNEFYIAFTVQLENGEWATIVDPNPISATTYLNGNQATNLFMVGATYNETTGTLALYVNGTLVSEAQLPSGFPKELNNSPLSIMDVGSIYNSTSNSLKSIPGVAGDVFTVDSKSYSFDGALGPTIVYDMALPPQAIKFAFNGELPDYKDIVVLWTQNFVVYSKILNIYPLETVECYSTQQPQPGHGSYGYLNGQMVGYEVYNLINENEFNGFWGLAGAEPTAFTPFGSLVLWSGGTPLIYNPSILEEFQQNVSIEFQTFLNPSLKGQYTFAFNFTDCPPGITTETHGGNVIWANEYAKVYINGKLVFNGYMNSNKQIQVLYSDISAAVTNNQPIFDYFFTSSANITIIITFNVPNTYKAGSPLGIFFGLMWEPPGYQGLVPVPLNYFQTQG